VRHLSAGLHIVMTDLRTGLLKFGYAESEDRLNNLVNLLIEWDFAVIENLQHADFFADECVPDDGRCPSSVCVCVCVCVCALIAVHVVDTGLAVRRTCSKDSISGRRTLNSWVL